MTPSFAVELAAGTKISLRLSGQTWNVLDNDAACFAGAQKPLSLSALIARLLPVLAPEAEASVAWTCTCSGLARNSTAWNHRYEELCRNVQARLDAPRRSRAISLNAGMCSFSQSSAAADAAGILLPGSKKALYPVYAEYIAALLEEYAAKSYSAREQLFFRPICEVIRKAAAEGNSLALTHQDGQRYRFWPRPAGALLTDTLLPYTYLVGFRVMEQADGKPRKYASLRLSEIREACPAAPSDLTKRELKELENAIEERGIPYLSGDHAGWALVCFAKNDLDDFRKRLINRPVGHRCTAAEALLPGLPPDAEVWMLEGTEWKLWIYLRTFGDIYIFAGKDLTPELWAALAGETAAGRSAASQQEAVKAIRSTFLKKLQRKTVKWHQNAHSGLQDFAQWKATHNAKPGRACFHSVPAI